MLIYSQYFLMAEVSHVLGKENLFLKGEVFFRRVSQDGLLKLLVIQSRLVAGENFCLLISEFSISKFHIGGVYCTFI